MGRKLKNSDRATAKFIRIRDEKNWDVIDELMLLAKFKCNFNKLINDALDYGLPLLYAAEFGIIKQDEAAILPSEPKPISDVAGDNYLKIIRLLQDIIVNENINKSILCSLFHVKGKELLGEAPDGKQFDKGFYQDTPDFLINYEMRELKKIKK